MLETTERSEVPHTPYHRFDVRALDALTLFVPTVGYVSVNSPRTLYRSKRGITIQTAGETLRFPSLNTEVSSVVHQGETLTNDEDLFYALVPSVRQILDRLFEDLFTPDTEPLFQVGDEVTVNYSAAPVWNGRAVVTENHEALNGIIVVRMLDGDMANKVGGFTRDNLSPAPSPFQAETLYLVGPDTDDEGNFTFYDFD
jgi:hypothetical protein